MLRKNIKVYCMMCREHILNTSERFVCGGPYNGAMFEPIETENTLYGMYFSFDDSVMDGNLVCPRCENNFIEVDGTLLTEYGMVKKGQGSISWDLESLAYDAEGHPLSRSDVWAKEEDRRGRVGNQNPFLHGSIENPSKRKPVEVEEVKPQEEEKPQQKWEAKVKCKKCGQPIRWPAEHRHGCPKPPEESVAA